MDMLSMMALKRSSLPKGLEPSRMAGHSFNSPMVGTLPSSAQLVFYEVGQRLSWRYNLYVWSNELMYQEADSLASWAILVEREQLNSIAIYIIYQGGAHMLGWRFDLLRGEWLRILRVVELGIKLLRFTLKLRTLFIVRLRRVYLLGQSTKKLS